MGVLRVLRIHRSNRRRGRQVNLPFIYFIIVCVGMVVLTALVMWGDWEILK